MQTQRAAITKMVLAGAAAALLTGCAAPVGGRVSTAPAEIRAGGEHHALVFATPRIERALASERPEDAPEFARSEARLGAREEQPLLATSQWPESRRADLRHPRYVYLPTTASTQVWFEREGWWRWDDRPEGWSR